MFNIRQFNWRYFWHFFTLNPNDPRNFDHFSNVESMLLEQERHRTYHKYIIHPNSIFRVLWETFYAGYVIISIMMSFSTLSAAYFKGLPPSEVYLHSCADIPLLLNIILNFRTGFFKADRVEAILNFSSIWRQYCKSLFIFDFFGLVFGSPLMANAYTSPTVTSRSPRFQYYSWIILINFGVLSRSVTPIFYWRVKISKYVMCSKLISYIVGYFLITPVIIFFLTSLVYFGDCLLGNRCTSPHSNNPTRIEVFNRFMSLVVPVISDSLIFDMNLNYTIIIVCNIAGTFITYVQYFLLSSFLILLFWAERGPSNKYNDLLDTLHEYLLLNKISDRLKMRITKYYEETYHGRFYDEHDLLNLFSPELKEDLVALKISKLREQITIFSLIPIEELILVSKYLVFEVFFGNDVICYSGSPHDRMYFVARGTVAVFTDKAMELYHVSNSAFFLVSGVDPEMPITTLNFLACETTVLYSLSRKDYKMIQEMCPVFGDLLDAAMNFASEILNFIKEKEEEEYLEVH